MPSAPHSILQCAFRVANLFNDKIIWNYLLNITSALRTYFMQNCTLNMEQTLNNKIVYQEILVLCWLLIKNSQCEDLDNGIVIFLFKICKEYKTCYMKFPCEVVVLKQTKSL